MSASVSLVQAISARNFKDVECRGPEPPHSLLPCAAGSHLLCARESQGESLPSQWAVWRTGEHHYGAWHFLSWNSGKYIVKAPRTTNMQGLEGMGAWGQVPFQGVYVRLTSLKPERQLPPALLLPVGSSAHLSSRIHGPLGLCQDLRWNQQCQSLPCLWHHQPHSFT